MPITVTLALDNNALLATTPSGKEVRISIDYQGLLFLQSLCKWERSLKLPKPPTPKPGLSAEALSQLFTPSDYTRVCHCGEELTPFMERCTGCPGSTGAGKVRVSKFNQKNRRQYTLADFED